MEGLDGDELARAIEEAQAVWPGVEVPPAVFAQWVAERLGRGEPLAELKIADVYLACACFANDRRALQYFEDAMLAPVGPALRRLAMSAEAIDETKQVLRGRFFVGEDGPPRIAEYSGRGDLRSWVRVAAVRAALRVVRRPKGQVDIDSSVIRAVTSPREDLELEYMKRRYSSEFERALRDALAELPTRDRNVLRYYYAERLTIDAIGALYRTHRATAARWVRRSVEALVDQTRRILKARVGANEVSSIMRMIQSQLESALRSVFLGAPSGDPGED